MNVEDKKALFTELISLTKNKKPGVRLSSMQVLREISKNFDERQIKIFSNRLLELKQDKEEYVRNSAAYTLTELPRVLK